MTEQARVAPRIRGGAAVRSLFLVLGLFLFALGIVLLLESGLGLSPWDVLHDGLRAKSPLSFGAAVILVGIALVVATTLAGLKPGAGTISNMVLIGIFVDLLLALRIAADAPTWPGWARVTLTITGRAAVPSQ